MQFDQGLGNCQPKTEAFELPGDSDASLFENIEDARVACPPRFRYHYLAPGSSRVRPPVAELVTRIMPFSGVNLIAFVSTFESTCWSRPESPAINPAAP